MSTETVSYDDVLDSILAVDTYMRDGEYALPQLQGANSGAIGDFEIGESSTDAGLSSGVFFAQSYIDGDNTIISYQGIYGIDQVGDPITLAGGGLTAALVAAAQFYQYVVANPASSQSSQQVSIAGYSYGGAIGEIISSVYNLNADLIDPTGFSTLLNKITTLAVGLDSGTGVEVASTLADGLVGGGYGAGDAYAESIIDAFYDDSLLPYYYDPGASLSASQTISLPNSTSAAQNIFAVNGEIATSNWPEPNALMMQIGNSYPSLDAGQLHDAALAAIVEFGYYISDNDPSTWLAGAGYVIPALFNANIGLALGFSSTFGPASSSFGGLSGEKGADYQLRAEIAYSGIQEGTEPFGDTGVWSLFSDATSLTDALNQGKFAPLITPVALSAIAEIAVQKAGDLAAADVKAPSADNGAFLFDDDVLTINLNPKQWNTTFAQQAPSIVGLTDLASALKSQSTVVYPKLITSVQINQNSVATNAADSDYIFDHLDDAINDNTITQILIGASTGGAVLNGSKAANQLDGNPGGNLIIGDNGNDDTITGSPGQDFIFLGTGNNTVYASWGDDIIVGGGGKNKILIDDSIFNDPSKAGATGPAYYFAGGADDQVDIGESTKDKFTLNLDPDPSAGAQNAPIQDGQAWTYYTETKNGLTYSIWVDPVDTYNIDAPVSATTNTSQATDDANAQGAPDIEIDTSSGDFTSATFVGNWQQAEAIKGGTIDGGTPGAGYGNKLNMQTYVSPTPLSGVLNDGQKVTFKGVVFQGDKLYGTGLTFKNFQILYADPSTGGATYDDYISGRTDFKDIYLGNGNNVVDNLSGGVLPGQAQTLGAAAHWVTVNLGTGDSEVLGTTAPGSEIFAQGATHHDIINISPDIEINNLTADDQLTYNGELITGGTANVASGTDWYTSGNGQLEFAVDSSDELVIKPTTSYLTQLNNALFGVTTSVDPATYVTNYQAANIAGNGDLVTGATAGITLVAVKYSVHMLLGGTPFVELNPFFIYNAESLAWFGKNYEKFDPLVVDLAGTGLNFTAVDKGQGPRFDVTGDGFANPSSWITPGEGYLVTVAANGAVSLVTSFAQLAAYDANGDGVLDATDLASSADAALPELRVWIDPTSGHTPQDDDLLTLAQAGIQSISLAPTAAADDDVIGDVLVNATASVTLTSGATSTVGAVTLNVDYADSTWQGDDSVTANAAALPNLTGGGTLPDLDVALSLDENAQIAAGTLTGGAPTALESAVAASVANFPNVTPTLADWRQAADAVLTDWADAFANPLPGSTANWWNDATDPTGVDAGVVRLGRRPNKAMARRRRRPMLKFEHLKFEHLPRRKLVCSNCTDRIRRAMLWRDNRDVRVGLASLRKVA